MDPAFLDPAGTARAAPTEPAPVAEDNEEPLAPALDMLAVSAEVRPSRRESAKQGPLDSTSPLASTAGEIAEGTTPVVLPELPTAAAA